MNYAWCKLCCFLRIYTVAKGKKAARRFHEDLKAENVTFGEKL